MKSTYHIPRLLFSRICIRLIQYTTYAPFNSGALYYENDEYIRFDVNHQNIESQLSYEEVRDSWGDSLSWLNIDSTGMMTGYVPSYFDEGGGNVIASFTDEFGIRLKYSLAFSLLSQGLT